MLVQHRKKSEHSSETVMNRFVSEAECSKILMHQNYPADKKYKVDEQHDSTFTPSLSLLKLCLCRVLQLQSWSTLVFTGRES